MIQQKQFLTQQGRLSLYNSWVLLQFADHRLQADTPYTLQQRSIFLADWLRWCVAEKHLDPHTRLPPYEDLAALPFDLEKQDVAQVVELLRAERILPARKRRKDANRPQWTSRDRVCLSYIGHMHALRLDQLQRLLARTAPSKPTKTTLSLSRTWEIVDRWVKAKFAIYKQVYHQQPGWVFLTRKGLHFVELHFRAEAPSTRLLEHLYWINEVRMKLECDHPELQWISERSLQAGKSMREAGQKRKHLPDGILILPPNENGEKRAIDVEIQISKPIPKEVKKIMAGEDFWTDNAPLRYYVNKISQGVVRSIYNKMRNDPYAMRPSIEIIDLEQW